MTKYFNTQSTQTFVNKLKFGNSALKTNAKTLVGAINELKVMIDNLPQPQIVHDYSNWQQASGISNKSLYSVLAINNTLIAITDAGDQNVAYSKNNGKSWRYTDYYSYMNNAILNNDTVIVGTKSKGIIYSEDDGITWQNTNKEYDSWAVFTTNSSGILIALNNVPTIIDGPQVNRYDYGIMYSEDGGKTWQSTNITTGCYEDMIITGDGTLIAKASNKAPVYSEDGGRTWQECDISTDIYSGYRRIRQIKLTTSGTLLLSTYGDGSDNYYNIYYSEDNGKTWQHSSTPSVYGHYACFYNAGDNVIAEQYASNIHYILYSEDGGKTWLESNVKVTDTSTTSPITSYPNRCLVHNSIIIFGSPIQGGTYVKYSEDSGKTWQNTNLSGSSKVYYAFAVTSDGIIIGAGTNGIVYSEDGGKTWQNTNINTVVYAVQVIDNAVLAYTDSKVLYC